MADTTTEWIVAATDGTACYLYGPFPDRDAAWDWRLKTANALFGREVHVMPHRLISPEDNQLGE